MVKADAAVEGGGSVDDWSSGFNGRKVVRMPEFTVVLFMNEQVVNSDVLTSRMIIESQVQSIMCF